MNKKIVNKNIINQTSFDSGSLTPLQTVYHKFTNSGSYYGILLKNDVIIGKFLITVNDTYKNNVIKIDIKNVIASQTYARNDKNYTNQFTLQTNGYATIYVSSGLGGYSIRINRIHHNKTEIEFDNRELCDNDIFSIVLIMPGEYIVTNNNGKIQGKIIVNYPSKIQQSVISYSSQCTINVVEDSFQPDIIKVNSGDLQIYHIKIKNCRLKIRLKEIYTNN